MTSPDLSAMSSQQLIQLLEDAQHAYTAAVEREAEQQASIYAELMQQATQLRAAAVSMRQIVGIADSPDHDTLRELAQLGDEELLQQTAHILRVLLAATAAGITSTADVCDVAAAAVEMGATQAV